MILPTARLALALLLPPHAPRFSADNIACVCKGDVVQIVSDVMVKGTNTKGMVGDVLEDLDENDAEEWGACCELAFGQASLNVRLRPTVMGYFEPGELQKLSGSKGCDIDEGDRVRVTDDVQVKGGRNSNGWEGMVYEVWSDCETDPCCVCNELSTVPIKVMLELPTDADAAADQPPPLEGLYDPDEVKVLRASVAR